MTAVEWLVDKLMKAEFINTPTELIEQAKQMEKIEHGKTWDAAIDAMESRGHNVVRAYTDFDDYFDETYGSKGSEHIENTLDEITTSSQTEISDEEIDNASYDHYTGDSYWSSRNIGFQEGARWMREQLKTKTMTQKAVEIYHRFVRYEWEEISDTMKESILEAINEALKISNTSSKTEISDEEIHRQADKEFRHFEDEDKDIWIRACQWYREQLKQRQ